MGLIHFGIPEQEALFLKEIGMLDIFVETGTYHGHTAKRMSRYFTKVFIIEKSNVMFHIAKHNLKDINNCMVLQGDSREHLNTLLNDNDNILFWLDAHWSGGDTYGQNDEYPLFDELQIILCYNKLIMVDDARLFLAPPPIPHNYRNWPSINDIYNVLPADKQIIIFEDVIYIYSMNLEDKIKNYFQRKTTEQWQNFGKETNITFINGLKTMIKGLLRGKIV